MKGDGDPKTTPDTRAPMYPGDPPGAAPALQRVFRGYSERETDSEGRSRHSAFVVGIGKDVATHLDHCIKKLCLKDSSVSLTHLDIPVPVPPLPSRGIGAGLHTSLKLARWCLPGVLSMVSLTGFIS